MVAAAVAVTIPCAFVVCTILVNQLTYTAMEPIVFFDESDKSYCNKCDYILIPISDKMLVCSGCETTYSYDDIVRHHSKLGPRSSVYDDNDVGIALMDQYGKPAKKPPTQGEIEDQRWVSQGSGRSIVEAEDY